MVTTDAMFSGASAFVKWSGAYGGKGKVLDFFGRQAQALGAHHQPSTSTMSSENDDHVVAMGSATAPNGSSAGWKFVHVFHIRDEKVTEAWGMTENDAAVDPFWDGLSG